jgi:hypothetical protein
MRLIGLAMAAAVVMATVPAHAEWKSYKFPGLGFGIDFPAQPAKSEGLYRGRIAGRNPSTIVQAKVGEVTYRATIVDFTKRLEDGPTLIGEDEFLLTQDGDVITDTSARAEAGPRGQYGRRIVTMLKDGTKRLSEVFLAKGRLYQLDTLISAKGDQGDPDAARFQDSLIFDLTHDWTIPPPLPKDPKNGPRYLHPVKPGEQASK